MSQTQTIQPPVTISLAEYLDDGHKTKQTKQTSPKKQQLSTLDSLLSPHPRPRKFDNKGRRNAEWEGKLKTMTPLQKHSAYFLSGPESEVIYPLDTWTSVRAWGWNYFFTILTVLIVHLALAYFTQPRGRFLPDPRLGIYINNIHKAKHGSDSGGYNSHGAYRRQLLDDFFAYNDKDNKGGLTAGELYNAWAGQRIVLDPFGWSAAAFEWTATYLLMWPDDGVLRKEDAEGVFDGEMFWTAKYHNDQRRVKRGLKPIVY